MAKNLKNNKKSLPIYLNVINMHGWLNASYVWLLVTQVLVLEIVEKQLIQENLKKNLVEIKKTKSNMVKSMLDKEKER